MISRTGLERESFVVESLSAEIVGSVLHPILRILVRSRILIARTDPLIPAQIGYLVECGEFYMRTRN